MKTATQEQFSQLQEINRALAHDLDVTRRIVRELHGERDALLRGTEEAICRASFAEKRLYTLTAKLTEMSCSVSADLRGFTSPRAA